MADYEETDDTIDLPQNALEEVNAKKCCNCGKDLRGHRRFKDSVGYWCKDCHRADKARHKEPEGRCPDCGRMRPLDKLFAMPDGRQVCSNCKKTAQAELEKKQVKILAQEEEDASERRKLYVLFGILLAIGLVAAFQVLHKYFR